MRLRLARCYSPSFYLAGRYERRAELAGYAAELRAAGFTVSGRWLEGNHAVTPNSGGSLPPALADQHERFAQEDVEDLLAANTLISFTESPETGWPRGGRHVEFGIACLAKKALWIVGPRENIFHWLDGVVQFADWPAVKQHLSRIYAVGWTATKRVEGSIASCQSKG